MEVIRAKSAGFCFGVKRAVDTVYEQVEKQTGKQIYTYGPIIHNEEVVKDMEAHGVKVLRSEEELKGLEEELGTVMASSPTVNVGYEVLSELPKERHESPMLSLDKTKEVTRLKEFVGDQTAVISWKMDGLTIVLTYRDGELFKAVTRGNGEVGEVITNNAKVFKNVPLHIPYKGELILRGEAVIGYKDFERINEEIDDVDAKYKKPTESVQWFCPPAEQ